EVAATVRPALVERRRAGPGLLTDLLRAEPAAAVGALQLAVSDRSGERREQRLQLLANRVLWREELRKVSRRLRANKAVLLVVPDLLLQHHQPGQQRFRPGRAPGDVDVHGHDEVDAGQGAVAEGERPAH